LDNCIRSSQSISTEQVSGYFCVLVAVYIIITFRGVVALEGWSLSVEDDQSRQDLVGHGYVLDAVSAMELPDHFPTMSSQHFVYFHKNIKQKVTPRYATIQGNHMAIKVF